MKVGIIADRSPYIGGAEISLAEYLKSAPDDVEVVYGGTPDVWVVGNCTNYGDDIVHKLCTAPVVKRVADSWPHGDPVVREWILTHADTLVFVSPTQVQNFPHSFDAPHTYIPSPIDLSLFTKAASRSTKREGTIWLGNATDHVRKGIPEALQWSRMTGRTVDFYGEQLEEVVWALDRDNPLVRAFPSVKYREVPDLLARYGRFLFLPSRDEAFGRTVIEALAAGCKVTTNAVPGCMWYLENNALQKIESSVTDFWNLVRNVANNAKRVEPVTR